MAGLREAFCVWGEGILLLQRKSRREHVNRSREASSGGGRGGAGEGRDRCKCWEVGRDWQKSARFVHCHVPSAGKVSGTKWARG